MRGLVLRLPLSHIIKSHSGWFELMTLLQMDEYVNGNVRPGFSPTLFNSSCYLGCCGSPVPQPDARQDPELYSHDYCLAVGLTSVRLVFEPPSPLADCWAQTPQTATSPVLITAGLTQAREETLTST